MPKRFVLVAALCALSVGLLRAGNETASPTPAPDDESTDSAYDNIQVLARAIQLIRQDYVDGRKTSYKDLTYGALRGMLNELDPHSQFMAPDDFKDMQDDTKSQFGGLGITVTIQDGMLTIVAPMEDSPSFQAGLMPEDRILRINGKSTEKFTISQAVDKLRGDVGEQITLTIQRPSTKEIKDYTLTRAIIKVPSVKDAQILPTTTLNDTKIGYVRITQFNEPTAQELERAVDKLEKEGMQALVIDLRYNPGGLLGSAVDVCGLFLPNNTKIVSTEGPSPSREYSTSSRGGAKRKFPIAVLVNYASASGSEIVAGSLKDLHRAIIVGETTFGKGSVQSVIALPDGSALRLTTAKYYTPSHNLIHEHGVAPNIRSALTYEQESDLLRSRRDQSVGTVMTLNLNRDPQLSRAVDALRGSIIFAERPQPAPAGKGS